MKTRLYAMMALIFAIASLVACGNYKHDDSTQSGARNNTAGVPTATNDAVNPARTTNAEAAATTPAISVISEHVLVEGFDKDEVEMGTKVTTATPGLQFPGERTVKDLTQSGGKWLVRKMNDGSFYAALDAPLPIPDYDRNLPFGDDVVGFVGVGKFVPAFKKLVALVHPHEVKDDVELYKRVIKTIESDSTYFTGAAKWYRNQSKERKTAFVRRFVPVIAPLASHVSRPLLKRYLLDLDWELDIVATDPRWPHNWPHDDPTATVPFFNNLSWHDVYFRLFWQRRGEIAFEAMKAAVKNELGG